MNRFQRFPILLLVLLLTAESGASASDPPWWPGDPPAVAAEYSGLARLLGCSGVFVDVGGPSTGPAYVITNGHCVGFPQPGEIWIDKYSYEEISFVSNTTHKRVNFTTKNIDYATMTGTDLALIKLNDATIASLQEKGVYPMRLAKIAPQIGDEVVRADIKNGFNSYHCKIESVVEHLQEGKWHFRGSYRHNCESSSGTSGSPMISARSGQVVAIHNTSVNKNNPCEVSAACEIDDQGKIKLFEGKKYAQRTQDIANCFNAEGIFDLHVPGCFLPAPQGS